MSRSSGKPCVKPLSLTVALATTPVNPLTLIEAGYGDAPPESGITMVVEFVNEVVFGRLKTKVTVPRSFVTPAFSSFNESVATTGPLLTPGAAMVNDCAPDAPP